MFAPFATSVVLVCEAQIVPELTVTVGFALTVTVAVAVAVQEESVPVMVYTVVEEGLALTGEPFVELSPVAGDHVYELAPFAVSVAVSPEQIVAPATVTVGLEITSTVVVSPPKHPFPSIPTTV